MSQPADQPRDLPTTADPQLLALHRAAQAEVAQAERALVAAKGAAAFLARELARTAKLGPKDTIQPDGTIVRDADAGTT